jgi:hypothetical protein
MRRVLFISPHFPPDSSAGAHRARLLAPHLAACGWTPTVVTLAADAYDARLDHELAAQVPGPLHVERVRAWHAAATRRVGVGDLGLRALWPLRQRCASLCRDTAFDVVYVTTYPTYPAVLGPWLKNRFEMRFVLDLQDPWVGSWGATTGPGGQPDLRSRLSRALAVRLEQRIVPAADALTSVSRGTLDELARRVPRAASIPFEEIPIGWDVADVERARLPRGNVRERWTAVYAGTLLPAGQDVVRAFLRGFRAWQLQGGPTDARVRFIGTSNQSAGELPRAATAIAADEDMAGQIDEEPARVPLLEAWRAQAGADLVLVLGTTEPHYTASKVFSALLSRRPVLAIVHAASSVAALIKSVPPVCGIELIEVGSVIDVPALAADVARRLEAIATIARDADVVFDAAALDAARADRLAQRLASLFDRICQGAAAA